MSGRGQAWLLAGALACMVPGVAWADDGHRGDRGRDDRAYGRSRYQYGEAHRRGLDRGYKEGLEHGEKDGRRGEDYNFQHHGEYRDADAGYRSHYGSRVAYSRAFRRGYEEGYRDAYQTYAHGRNGHGRDRYSRNDRYSRDRRSDDRYEPYYEAYDHQRDGRHRHREQSGWCSDRHDAYGDGRVIREIPRRY